VGRPELPTTYDELSRFHEPLTLFAFLAAVTSRIGLATTVLVLPQRQTALVEKQAAEISTLSGGRLRLGVGTGWNWIEYEALGEDFATRGRRLDEQIELLRLLWGSSSVSFDGEFHSVTRAGICPLPGKPIPIWCGGAADVAMRRAARLGDGFTFARPDEHVKIPRIVELVEQADRDPDSFG